MVVAEKYLGTGLAGEYNRKLVTADQAVKVINSGDTVHFGAFCGAVYELDQALAKRVDELKDVTCVTTIWPYSEPPAVVKADPNCEHFRWHTTQFSAVEREMNKAGHAWYIPVQFREQVKYWVEDAKIDVCMLQVAPMDEHGYFNVGPQVSDVKGVTSRARKIIVEVNDKQPRVCGDSWARLHVSQVDYIVEGPGRELPERLAKEATEVDRKIAEHIVPLIRNGSTLQLGIGGLPNCVGSLIAESDLTDLSVHSEMFVDAFLNLYKAGKISGKKNLDPGRMVWTFAMGSKELYQFVDRNPIHYCASVDYVNELTTIAAIDNFVSINSILEVDLYGQVNSETAGLQHIGGNGGQLDFVLGCYMSKGGQSFLCTPSTLRTKSGELRSLVRGTLQAGAVVTVPRQVTQNIVTEYGVANMKGKSTWQRAEALINVAHPDFRDELVKEAEKLGVWKYTSKRI